ncbi:hypothetical protein VHUM_01357 [Vanrija humicola]|uniref:Protein YIP n=1 Tax=Vanrija humicola TaxID=5417 RepID=A0A7D8Z7R6_VANHU|nr:hypothetical protein VHUM_01357 [Vanrija humicola]
MSQGGYAVVDADDGDGLQFKTFLGAGSSSPAPAGSSSRADPSRPAAPFSPFNLAYYAVYFDVDTQMILKRVGMSLVPRGGFIADACDGQVDLYGPFWTLTTLILLLYTTSTLTSSLQQYMAGQPVVSNLPLLSTATTLVYLYGLALPAALWALTRWLGVGSWGPAEALGVYGYAMSVFIPVSLLCLIPVGIARWAFVGLGAASSGFFLVTNIYPVLAEGDNKLVRLLVIGVGVLHAALALAMKVLFYSYSVGNVNAGPDPTKDARGLWH